MDSTTYCNVCGRTDGRHTVGCPLPHPAYQAILAERDKAQFLERDARAEAAQLKQENCDLLVGHAELTRRLDAAVKGIQIREERFERITAELRSRIQAEKDAQVRIFSLQDDEVAEFNAGYEAGEKGESIEAEPSDLFFDVWQHGWKVANHERLSAEAADLRRLLAEYNAEMQRLLVDNAKLRFYVVELEAASRTIDMLLAQQTAREKYDAAFGEQADRPVWVDTPGQPYCQLPEGHDGPHEHRCLACDGTGEIDSSPEYMRCPMCHGSGRGNGE